MRNKIHDYARHRRLAARPRWSRGEARSTGCAGRASTARRCSRALLDPTVAGAGASAPRAQVPTARRYVGGTNVLETRSRPRPARVVAHRSDDGRPEEDKPSARARARAPARMSSASAARSRSRSCSIRGPTSARARAARSPRRRLGLRWQVGPAAAHAAQRRAARARRRRCASRAVRLRAGEAASFSLDVRPRRARRCCRRSAIAARRAHRRDDARGGALGRACTYDGPDRDASCAARSRSS